VTTRLHEKAWRDLVQNHPDANIFHTPEMHEVFSHAEHHRPSLWAGTNTTGSAVALLPTVEVALTGGVLAPWTSRAVAYGGVLYVHDPDGNRAVAALLSAYRRGIRGRVLFTELRHACDARNLRPMLEGTGFSHEGHLNYLIRLDKPEVELWTALSKSAQQRIRSAVKKGVVVKEVTDAARCDDAYELLGQVYRRAQIPLADRSLFQAALSLLRPLDMLRIFTAHLGEQTIGVRFLLLHQGRMLDWYAGVDRAFATYSPNELLVWHALQWGQAHCFEMFDFGGAGRPDEPYGPREFKAKFGGELVNFGRDVLVHAPARLRLSRSIYAAARGHMWGRASRSEGSRA